MSTEQNLRDRLIRAKSWLNAASEFEANENQNKNNLQTVFLYYCIALNSLYGRRQYEGRTETKKDFERFFEKILRLHDENSDHGEHLFSRAIQECHPSWLSLMDNEFLDNGYWQKPVHGKFFKDRYRQRKKDSEKLFRNKEYKDLLNCIFSRVNVLRNQIVHGCATFGPTSKGWRSVEQATPVLRVLVPTFCELMEKHGHIVKWDKIPYPRLYSEQHPRRPFSTQRR